VSGVELLMNNHQSLKAEIDTREENFHQCITLGRKLLDRRHYASTEIEKKLIKLTTERAEMMHRLVFACKFYALTVLFKFLKVENIMVKLVSIVLFVVLAVDLLFVSLTSTSRKQIGIRLQLIKTINIKSLQILVK
jgi:hypothetical protein